MLKELFEYLIGLDKAEIVTAPNGTPYASNDKLSLLTTPSVPPLAGMTLSGLVDYIKENRDGAPLDKCLVQVKQPWEVRLLGPLSGTYGVTRQSYYIADCQRLLPEITEQYQSLEKLIIMLQTKFVADETRDALVKSLRVVTADTSVTFADDGLSQRVEVSSGAGLKGRTTIPSVLRLVPLSLFPEVPNDAKPSRTYTLRLRKDADNNVQGAFLPSDGNAWYPAAIIAVKEHLETALAETGVGVFA